MCGKNGSLQIEVVRKPLVVGEGCELGAGEPIELAWLLGREDPAGQASSTRRDAVAGHVHRSAVPT